MLLIPLEVDHQTIHVVPTYEIQIRCKIGENCSSLGEDLFIVFWPYLLFTINLVKIAVFLKLIGHYIKFKRMPIPNHFQCLKSIGKAINHYHCLMKPMQLGFNNGNTGVAGILQKQQ